MPTSSELLDSPEPPVDRLRIGLAICSAVSIVPFALVGYRVLLLLPFIIAVYLCATGFVGHDFARSRSTLAWSLRLLAAFGVTWIFTTFVVAFLHVSSSGKDSDVFMFLVPAALLFAAVIYRAPFLPSHVWARHLTALLCAVFATALLYIAVGVAIS